jgi:diguanylate cyclase (GGDEF)-like protein
MNGSETLSVLVVEDSATQAAQLRSTLERHGYRVRVATDGMVALGMIAEQPPSLVISDILMPEMDGYQLCAAIRADETTRDLPVVLLTSLSSPRDILRALECGADSFISKPYSSEYLVARLESTLKISCRCGTGAEECTELVFGDETIRTDVCRQRILDLLVCTYESTVLKNRELLEAQKELKEANLRLEMALDEVTEAQRKALALADENRRLYDEMKQLSLQDHLTGLPNRRMLDIGLDSCLARTVRFSVPFCLLMLDIDFFKNYNDVNGHDAGDRILVSLAESLKQCVRLTDLAARYGGEEFILLVSDTALEGAVAFAERVRVAVQEQVGVTVSVGVAQYHAGMTTAALIKSADEALYQAKRNGRNRVESAPIPSDLTGA